MNTQPQVKYVKTFSKGQITIPKEFRDAFGLGHEFWLKVYIRKDEIILEPIREDVRKNQHD